MKNNIKKELSAKEAVELISNLKLRFDKNMHRHTALEWNKIEDKLKANPSKLWSLSEMEKTGGEPDVVAYDKKTDEYVFFDCSPESPKDRRSLCYDREALEARKEFKPENNAVDFITEIGAEILTEFQYRELQKLGTFDTKSSSWLKTPEEIRQLGGAIFAEFRYNTVFVFHNSAPSYYAIRGVRACLKV